VIKNVPVFTTYGPEHLVDRCTSRTGIKRQNHYFCKDGLCVFCDRPDKLLNPLKWRAWQIDNRAAGKARAETRRMIERGES
jgi:hypothetical protein